jgi:hypothetical protein
VLTSLLQPDKPPSIAHIVSPTLTYILQSDQVTSSTGRRSPESVKSDVLKRSDLGTAAEHAANVGRDASSLSEILVGENPINKSADDVDSISQLLDESSSIFENGIAAMDVSQLLAQFEDGKIT